MTNSLRKKRRELDISQDDLAAEVNISRTYLINLEKGRQVPSVKIALRLAKALDCDVRDIFSDKNVNNGKHKKGVTE